MVSERVQRQIDHLLDEAEEAAAKQDWATVRDRTRHALTFDPENVDARALLGAAERGLGASQPDDVSSTASQKDQGHATPHPTSFVNGRYQVKRFLGEGGKKRVYRAPRRRGKEAVLAT